MWEKIALFLLNFIFKGVALLPFTVLYGISNFLYYLTYYIVRYRRKVVRQNLNNSFPDKTEKEIIRIEKLFFRHFCDYIVETIKLLHISDEEMKRRLRFTNIDVIEKMRSDGNPILLYLGHYGNWEYITSITLWMKEGMAPCQVYHPLTNKVMDKFFYALRSRFHTLSIPQKQTLRVILTFMKEGKQPILGLISDQRPRKKFSTTWMRFLHQETALITGGETMGLRLNAHFVYIRMKCVRRGYYEATFIPIQPVADEEFSHSKQYMRMLEKDILEAPQYWLWSHKRWKFSYQSVNLGQKFPE